MSDKKNIPRTDRFFDDGDFTSEHDAMDIALVVGGWVEIVEQLFGVDEITWYEGAYNAEPPLEGYPTVYPDAIITKLKQITDHKGVPVRTKRDGVYSGSYSVECSVCRCWMDSESMPQHWDDIKYSDDGYSEKKKQREAEWVAGLASRLVEKPCVKAMPAVCVEIKPEVDSFGKVLRQLNIYRSRMDSESRIVLVTHDTRYDEPFKKQRVDIYHPPGGPPPKSGGIDL